MKFKISAIVMIFFFSTCVNGIVAGSFCNLTIENKTSQTITLYVTGNITGFKGVISVTVLANSSNILANIDKGNTIIIDDRKGWKKSVRIGSDRVISYP